MKHLNKIPKKIKMKYTNIITWNRIGSIGIVMLLVLSMLSACSDDNSTSAIEENEIEAETAFFIGASSQTPSGRVFFLGAFEQMPSTIDLSEMVELGSGVSMTAFGEHTYVWNSNASTLTKYGVESDLSINVAGVMSFASTGISGSFRDPAYISETEAYFFAVTQGKIVEFSPTDMTITEVIDVEPTQYDPDPNGSYSPNTVYVSNDKAILPLEHAPDDLDQIAPFASVAVFDPSDNSFTIHKDTRMSSGYDIFAPSLKSDGSLNENEYFYRPANSVPFAEAYGNSTDHPTTAGLLRVRADGTFDENSFLDLREILPAKYVRQVTYVFDNKAVVTYHDDTFTAPEDPGDFWGAPQSTALVDLENETWEPFSALEKYGGFLFPIGQDKNGTFYFKAWAFDGSGESYVMSLNSPTSFNEVTTAVLGENGGTFWLAHQAR